MIQNQVALITGGARGIGQAIAGQLASEGYAVAILDRVAAAGITDSISKIKAHGQPFLYLEGDITSAPSRLDTLGQVLSAFGRLDVLVNNAGVAPRIRQDILEMTEESFDQVLGVNLKGTFFLTQLAAEVMVRETGHFQDISGSLSRRIDESGQSARESDRAGYILKCLGSVDGIKPKIINISSVSAYASSTQRGEYCISKAGVSMVTTLFADRLAEYGIHVFEIRPGIIYTDMTAAVKEKYDRLIENGLTPIRRWGYPQDVANAVSVLCSDKLSFSTGEIINVDGGFHIRRL